MSLVILEGPDGSGKSTLAQDFIAKGYRYVHHGPSPELNARELIQWYVEAMSPALRYDVVMDRAWPSEIVYSSIYRPGECRISKSDMEQLEAYAKLLDPEARIIVCLPPLEKCREAWRARRKLEWEQEEKLTELWAGYSVTHEFTSLLYSYYDYTTGGANAAPF